MAHVKIKHLVLLAAKLQASTIGLSYQEIKDWFEHDLLEKVPSQRSLQRILGSLRDISNKGFIETAKWQTGYGEEFGGHLTKRFMMRGLPSALLSLTDEERVALERLLNTLPHDLGKTGLTKLLAVTDKKVSTTRLKNKLDELIDREIHTGFVKARTHETISQISILEDAINDAQEIEFYYKSQRAKKAILRRVRPIGLLFGRFAYLVARPSSDSGYRAPQSYRMDLLDDVKAVDSFFEANKGFSFKDWSKQSYGIYHGDTEIKVKLLFSKEVADRASKITFHSSQQMTQHKNGTLTVMLRCKGHQELIHELIHPDWIGKIKIQEPPELQAEYLEYLERAKAAIFSSLLN